MSESISFEGELRTLLRTGKVILGTKRTLKMLKLGKVKGIIIASTLSQDLKDDLIHYAKLAGIPYYEYKGSALELGTLCGKPFIVSAIGVIDEGESKIFQNK